MRFGFLKQHGFSMVELVAVMVVVAILVAILSTRFTGATIANLDAQREQLMHDIRYIQFLAMTQKRLTRINFASGAYTYTDSTGAAINHPAQTTNSVTLGSGITLSWSANLTNSYILFDTQGVPYTAPGTPLAATATLTLTGEGTTKTLLITPETGKVTVGT